VSRSWRLAAVGVLALTTALAGCGSEDAEEAATSSADVAAAIGSPSAAPTATPHLANTHPTRTTPKPKTSTTHRAAVTHRATPTHRPTPRPTHRATPKPAPARVVHPGAYCSPGGATGVTAKGTPMECKGPGRNRWRAA
jgi:hypothetical protein